MVTCADVIVAASYVIHFRVILQYNYDTEKTDRGESISFFMTCGCNDLRTMVPKAHQKAYGTLCRACNGLLLLRPLVARS
jgi:hypothetical protein